jgi:hypothetical protein
MHYFVPLETSEKDVLSRADIQIVDFNLHGERGIVLDDTQAERSVRMLGYKIVDIQDTEYRGFKRLVIRKDGDPVVAPSRGEDAETGGLYDRVKAGVQKVKDVLKPSPVSIEGWNGGEIKKEFINVAQSVLYDDLQRDIIISVPHKNIATPKDDGKLHIWIWSQCDKSCVAVDTYLPPNYMWGIKVECRDPAYTPSFKGIPIFSDDGYVAAELVNGNNLYIHHDICHHGFPREVTLFERLLKEAKPVIMDWMINNDEAKARGLFQQKMMDTYVEKSARRINESVDLLKDKEVRLREETRKLQIELANKTRELSTVEESLKAMNDKSYDPKDRFRQEFLSISKNEKIKSFFITDQTLTVLTNTLYCIDPRSKREHEIGEFKIVVFLDGPKDSSEDYIRFYNLTRRVDAHSEGMHAPHIFSNGKACLGNVSKEFPKLIGRSEYSVIIFLAIQFIESVNVNDGAGKHVDKWPLSRRKTDEH